MREFKIKQLLGQSNSWKRLLGFLLEENAFFKDRLSDLLKDKIDADFLETLENFHNRSVREDELINLIRDELAELDHLLTREIFEDGNMLKLTEQQYRKVKINIETAEKAFVKLLQDFNSYVLESVFS